MSECGNTAEVHFVKKGFLTERQLGRSRQRLFFPNASGELMNTFLSSIVFYYFFLVCLPLNPARDLRREQEDTGVCVSLLSFRENTH